MTRVVGYGVQGFSGDNGPAIYARLLLPAAVAVDSAGNLFIAYSGNYRIREISNGIITTVAGNGENSFSGDDGPATSAQLGYMGDNGATAAQISQPEGVALDAAGNLYIADSANNVVREVSNGVISTTAGNGRRRTSSSSANGDDGPATAARITPSGVAVDASGNVYVTDDWTSDVRKISNGVITTIAGINEAGFGGDNGPATNANLNTPVGQAIDAAGNLYIADGGNDRVRKISNGVITTVAGNGVQGFSGDGGPATSAMLNDPYGVAVDSAGDVYVYDSLNNRIRLLSTKIQPIMTPGGIVPIYSSVSTIQPGSWFSIYGSNLANGTYLWNNDFP